MPNVNDSNKESPRELSKMLAWIQDAIGGNLLAYILGCDTKPPATLLSGEIKLTDKQRETVSIFSDLRSTIPSQLDDINTKEAVRNFVTQVTGDGKSVARALREHVLGPEEIPHGRDDMENALIVLAVDAYPACLLPPDPALPPMVHYFGLHLASLIFRHPQAKLLHEAVLRDPVLKNVFAEEGESTGPVATTYQSTGRGGTFQLWMIPEMLLQAAWRKLTPGEFALEPFVAAAVDQLQLVRAVFAGEKRTITAKLAFAGVLLPPNRELKLSGGVVRAANEADRRYAPEALKGQLSGTDSSGVSTVINYDGDIILEHEVNYKVQWRSGAAEQSAPLSLELQPPLDLEQIVTRLRFSLMLAVEREYRVQLVRTWHAFHDPLSHGMALSWTDPRQGASLMPTQLSESDIRAWDEWYQKLSTSHAQRIELALTRILRASAERREPSDVLIDSVIAWENIFGTREGEPTFRVTMCLARLLEGDAKARLALRTKLGRIYKLRSDVVHGGHSLQIKEYPLCIEALEIAIRAVRVLIADRTDILKLPDGAERSKVLLLES